MSAPALAALEHRITGYEAGSLAAQVLAKLLRPASELAVAGRPDGGLLARLRAMAPVRPLGSREAMNLAERQAQRFRTELGVISPRFDEKVLEGLDWLTVTRRSGFPTSGMATQVGGRWVVVIRSEEARVRQRFTLAHEVKHIVDDLAVIELAKRQQPLYRPARGQTASEQAERVADRFAAAVLMPRPLVRADWADGIQDVARLARRYGVSQQAMTFRLTQLGLLERTARCPQSRTSQGGS